MKPINFIERPDRDNQRSYRYPLSTCLFLSVLTLGSICYLSLRASKALKRERSKYARIAADLDAVNVMEQDLVRTRQEKDQLKQLMEKSHKKAQEQRRPLEALDDIARFMPASLLLDTVTLERRSISLEGRAPRSQRAAIQQLVAGCLEKPWCVHADLATTSDHDDLTFTITITTQR